MNRKWLYGLAGVGVLAVAGFMIFQALSTSLVYFILPNEHAADPAQYGDRRIRLGGIVTPGSIAYDERELQLTFLVTDGLVAYPVRPEVRVLDCALTDMMLLCTDGITKHVPDDEIRDVLLAEPSSEAACRRLCNLALERGGSDNITVIAGRIRPKPAAG